MHQRINATRIWHCICSGDVDAAVRVCTWGSKVVVLLCSNGGVEHVRRRKRMRPGIAKMNMIQMLIDVWGELSHGTQYALVSRWWSDVELRDHWVRSERRLYSISWFWASHKLSEAVLDNLVATHKSSFHLVLSASYDTWAGPGKELISVKEMYLWVTTLNTSNALDWARDTVSAIVIRSHKNEFMSLIPTSLCWNR